MINRSLIVSLIMAVPFCAPQEQPKRDDDRAVVQRQWQGPVPARDPERRPKLPAFSSAESGAFGAYLERYTLHVFLNRKRAFRFESAGKIDSATGHTGVICATQTEGQWRQENDTLFVTVRFRIPDENCGSMDESFEYIEETHELELSEFQCKGANATDCRLEITGKRNRNELCDLMVDPDGCDFVYERLDTFNFTSIARPDYQPMWPDR